MDYPLSSVKIEKHESRTISAFENQGKIDIIFRKR